MKKFMLFIAFIFILTSCSYKAQYDKNIEIAGVNENLKITNSLQKSFIYIEDKKFTKQDFIPKSNIGSDKKLNIGLEEFASGCTYRFFNNYLLNLEQSTDKSILNSNSLIIMPEIRSFNYGFYSADGFDIMVKPYITYEFFIKIFKNQKQIYAKKISLDERYFSDSSFFGSGKDEFAKIGPLLQKAIANDYNIHADEIIDAINSAK